MMMMMMMDTIPASKTTNLADIKIKRWLNVPNKVNRASGVTFYTRPINRRTHRRAEGESNIRNTEPSSSEHRHNNSSSISSSSSESTRVTHDRHAPWRRVAK